VEVVRTFEKDNELLCRVARGTDEDWIKASEHARSATGDVELAAIPLIGDIVVPMKNA